MKEDWGVGGCLGPSKSFQKPFTCFADTEATTCTWTPMSPGGLSKSASPHPAQHFTVG